MVIFSVVSCKCMVVVVRKVLRFSMLLMSNHPIHPHSIIHDTSIQWNAQSTHTRALADEKKEAFIATTINHTPAFLHLIFVIDLRTHVFYVYFLFQLSFSLSLLLRRDRLVAVVVSYCLPQHTMPENSFFFRHFCVCVFRVIKPNKFIDRKNDVAGMAFQTFCAVSVPPFFLGSKVIYIFFCCFF